jgi:hypothetical protein
MILVASVGLASCGGGREDEPYAGTSFDAREVEDTTVAQATGAKPEVDLGPIAGATAFRVTVRGSKGAPVSVRYADRCSNEVSGGIASVSGTSGASGFKGTSPFTRTIRLYGPVSELSDRAPEACGILVEAELAKGRRGDLEMTVEALLSDSAE